MEFDSIKKVNIVGCIFNPQLWGMRKNGGEWEKLGY